MSKQIIGVASGAGAGATPFRNGISHDYITSVINAGATPVIIPLSDTKDVIEQAVSLCDGVILTGGVDINPNLYQEDIHVACGETNDLRDTFEMYVLEACEKQNKPVLGICRGIQMINVYYGGTLYQDLPSEYPDRIKHAQNGSRGNGCHTIHIEDHSFLSEILGNKAYVNSYHHQAVKDLAEGFRVVARTNDGVVEAIEDTKRHIYGVQFHPEVMSSTHEDMLAIFKSFIAGTK